MIKKITEYVDQSFLIKFILLFVPLYYFHIFYMGVVDPKNYYSSFLDENLNYIKWITASINHTAGLFTRLFGIDPIINGKQIFVENGATVLLEYSCLGFGIMSFWAAFIIAHKTSWKVKLYWTFGGLLGIWFLNCWRIAILLVALQNRWDGTKSLDHHDIFNLVCYAIISGLIYIFYKNSKAYEAKTSVSSFNNSFS